MGSFEIKSSVKALPLFEDKLLKRGYKHGSTHLAQITIRMFTTLEGKGILRSAPEELNLAQEHKANDPLRSRVHTHLSPSEVSWTLLTRAL